MFSVFSLCSFQRLRYFERFLSSDLSNEASCLVYYKAQSKYPEQLSILHYTPNIKSKWLENTLAYLIITSFKIILFSKLYLIWHHSPCHDTVNHVVKEERIFFFNLPVRNLKLILLSQYKHVPVSSLKLYRDWRY